MISITITLLLSVLAAQSPTNNNVYKTPDTWLDSRIEKIDRLSMEQMISYAPPTLPKKTTWILPKGEKAPSWESLRGKVVVVQSWTNTKAEGRLAISAVMKTISKSKSPSEIVLVTIHTPESHQTARKYLAKKKLNLRTIVDSTGVICNSLGFYKDPASIVIDRNGVVRHVGLRTNGLRRAITELLGEKYDPKFKVEIFKPSKNRTTTPVDYPPHSINVGRATNMQGKPAPAFSVEKWMSTPVNVDGKVRLVEFWATWCLPCKKSIPHLNDLVDKFGDDIAIISVSSEPPSIVRSFMKKTPMKYSVAVDTQRNMQNAIACKAIPLVMVISSDGIVRWQGNPINVTSDTIQQIIRADRGESSQRKRGRWDTAADYG